MALLEDWSPSVEPVESPFEPVSLVAARVEALNRRLAGLSTRDALAAVLLDEFAGRIALVSSFGADSVVLLHLAAGIDASVPVVFVDTGKIFGSTHRYRDGLADRLGLTDVRLAQPDPAALELRDADSGLWLRESDACCAVRKVEPLARALRGFDAWISGRKRYQGGLREHLPLVEADGSRIKINPLAGWSKAELDVYRISHDLPEHPLMADGFRSIGCMPCTTRVAEGEDERDGRWRGRGKTECGIHTGLAAFETDGSGI